jgi:phage terminase Nu1 subunit (DNA packaging protein)
MQHLSNLDNRFGQGFAPEAAWLEQAVTTGEASRMTGVAVATLETWRSRGGGPPFLKLGRRNVRYQRRVLLAWMAEHERRNTADQGPGHG